MAFWKELVNQQALSVSSRHFTPEFQSSSKYLFLKVFASLAIAISCLVLFWSGICEDVHKMISLLRPSPSTIDPLSEYFDATAVFFSKIDNYLSVFTSKFLNESERTNWGISDHTLALIVGEFGSKGLS